MLKGDTKSFGIVLKWEFEVLAIMKGGTQKSTLCFRVGGRKQFYRVLKLRGYKKFRIRNFPMLYLPAINDRSFMDYSSLQDIF